MVDAPRLRGNVLARSAFLVVGLVLFALGIVLLLESRLGLSPWDVLNQGIAEQTPLSFGVANIAVAVAILAVAGRLSARIGPGTLANAVLVGAFVELFLRVGAVDRLGEGSLVARVGLLAAGIATIAIGSAFYIGAAFGAGPRDSLMLGLAQRTQTRVGVVRGALEGSATAVGFALGGTVGVGTLIFALGIGPAVELAFTLAARSPLVAPPASSHAADPSWPG
jgi:uncharacterized membrane protein YczE